MTRRLLTLRRQPIPTCVSDDRPAKYKPILAKDYVKDKVDIAYQAKKAKK